MRQAAHHENIQPGEQLKAVALIAGFFVIRMYAIAQAPLEAGHNWRQSLTNMVARNFLQISPDIRYPRIDMAGLDTGIIGTEFPLLNYLIYLTSLIFDFDHWYGRLINLVISSLGTYCFYRLVRAFTGQGIAMASTLILLSSIWFSFSRKSMPDTFSVSLVLCGLYAGLGFLQKGGLMRLLCFTTLIAAGMLSKIPSMSLTAVLVLLPFLHAFEKRRVWTILLAAVPAFVVALAWYLWWVPHLTATYSYALYFPKGLLEGLNEIIPLLPDYFKKFYFSALYSFTGLLLAIVGTAQLIRAGRLIPLLAVGVVTVVFVLFTFKTGAVFPEHNYYIIPFVPVMALLAGLGLARLYAALQAFKPQWAKAILAGVLAITVLEGVGNQAHDFFPKRGAEHKLKLEGIMNAQVPPGALIVINGGASPQEIYFANRRGLTGGEALFSEAALDSLAALGFAYAVINRHMPPVDWIYRGQEAIYQDADYRVYPLSKAGNHGAENADR